MDVIWPPDTPEETELIRRIVELQRRCEEDCRPYMERLTAIRNLKIPRYVITPTEAEAFRNLDKC